MGLTIHLTPRAGADLDEIKAYIRSRDTRAAERVRRAIERTIDTVSIFPDIARPTNIQTVSVILVPRYPYLVYHTAEADTLTVVHIRHASRDVPDPDELS